MSEENNTRQQATSRPKLDLERAYKFSAKSNPSALTKTYFEQLDSKGMKDPFNKLYRSENNLDIIKPPLNPYYLAKVVFENSFLIQCIESLVQNIHGFGYRMEFIGKEEHETSLEVTTELQYLEELFDAPNSNMSMSELRRNLGWDYFVFGNCYLEVTRDSLGRVITMHHLPAPTMRITKVDVEGTPIVEKLKRFGKVLKVNSKKNFRRFVQMNEAGDKVWFKEFGDPRTLDPKTGKENTALTLDKSSTEVIHIANYNAQSIYGIPIWHTQITSVLGSRQAELTNLDFFENNAIPAMAVLVAGGYLTEEAYEFLANNFEEIKGRGSTNRVLILEARGTVEDASNTGAVPSPSISMQALNKERQNDALWQEYEKQCRDKIRACFRLAPVLVGSATDYTFASARVSLEVSENQIFIPERIKFDDIINNKILETWDIEHHRFRSSPAAIATSEDLINAVNTFNDAGAMTPNIAVGILNEKLNLDIPRIQEFWGDLPFELMKTIFQSHGDPDKGAFVNHALDMVLNTKREGDTVSLPPPPKPVEQTTAETKTNSKGVGV
jgi:PBSX family phage portal protein